MISLKDMGVGIQDRVKPEGVQWSTLLRSTTTGLRTAPRNGVYPFKKIPQADAMTSWLATSDVPNPLGRAIQFYVQDSRRGQMSVRVCPYFPFSARVCLNQHYWLALRMQERGMRFQQCANAFLQSSDPQTLQKLADSLTANDLITCGQKWLTHFTPFFTSEERKQAGAQRRLFFCPSGDLRQPHLLSSRGRRCPRATAPGRQSPIGQPNKLTVIFGRRITRRHGGKLQTVIEDLNLPNPVIRSHYRKGFLKQYVRERFLLRTESATNNIYTDYGIGKAVENLAPLRNKLDGIIDRYLDVQQDILETFVDREQLRQLTQPTLLPNGRRIPGLKVDHPRQLALMHSLVRFCYLAAEGTFTTRELYPQPWRHFRC